MRFSAKQFVLKKKTISPNFSKWSVWLRSFECPLSIAQIIATIVLDKCAILISRNRKFVTKIIFLKFKSWSWKRTIAKQYPHMSRRQFAAFKFVSPKFWIKMRRLNGPLGVVGACRFDNVELCTQTKFRPGALVHSITKRFSSFKRRPSHSRETIDFGTQWLGPGPGLLISNFEKMLQSFLSFLIFQIFWKLECKTSRKLCLTPLFKEIQKAFESKSELEWLWTSVRTLVLKVEGAYWTTRFA